MQTEEYQLNTEDYDLNKDLFTIENNGTIKRKFKVGIGL